MTPSELAQHAPQLAKIREMLIAEINGVLAPHGIGLDFGQCDISATEYLILGFCCRIERQRTQSQASSQPPPTWRFALSISANGNRFLVFKANNGSLAKIPAGFVNALLRNQVLPADLSESTLGLEAYALSRSGKFEGHLPPSLLDYLLDLRARGETAGLLAAAGGVATEADAKSDGLSRPAKHPAERPSPPRAQPESSPGNTEAKAE
jgi:hypothetical protein